MNSIYTMIQTANSRKKYSNFSRNGGKGNMISPYFQSNSAPQSGTPLHTAIPLNTPPAYEPHYPEAATLNQGRYPAETRSVAQQPYTSMRLPPEIPAQIPTPIIKSGAIYRDLMQKHDRFTQRHL